MYENYIEEKNSSNFYTEFSIENIKNLLAIFNDYTFDMVRLGNFLFLVDSITYQKLGHAITGLSYEKTYYGVAPIRFEILLEDLYEKDIIKKTVLYNTYDLHTVKILNDNKINYEYFNHQELDIILYIIRKYLLEELIDPRLVEKILNNEFVKQFHFYEKINCEKLGEEKHG